MGEIYEAKHPVLGHSVAIKVMRPTASDMFERFRREARATAHLRNPHIATVVDVGTLSNGTPYMVMELLVGNDLAEEIGQTGPLPVESAVEYVTQGLEGIAAAHAAGIVHRDIKPSNIFLCKPTGLAVRTVVKLLDFGLVKSFKEGERNLTGTRDSFGTPQYMSPEQIQDVRSVDARADLWAFGTVLYEALVGRCPFEGSATNIIASIVATRAQPPSTLRPDIPPTLDAVVAKALEKDREKRFQTAEEFIYALAEFRPIPPSARTTPTPPQAFAPTELPPLLGLLLVGLGSITHHQLHQAIAIQEREPNKRLGDILVAIGACTPGQLRAALEKQKNSVPPKTLATSDAVRPNRGRSWLLLIVVFPIVLAVVLGVAWFIRRG